MSRRWIAALLLAAGCGHGEAARVSDTTATRAVDAQLSGDRVGPVPVSAGASAATLARFARVVRDTEELGSEGIPESVFVLVVHSDTVRAVHDSGRIYRLDVSSPAFRTMDSLGVGTTLARLLREPGVYAGTGEGAVYVGTPHHCGMSFRLSESGGLGDMPRDSIGAAELRQLPPTTRVSEVLVFGCKQPRVAQAPAPRADSTLVPRFLGCYALDDGDGRTYPIRLSDTRMGQFWVAFNVEAGNGNAPGNAWHWAPIDSTRFDLEWGGVDAAMQFTVTRRKSNVTATGQRWSSGPMPAGELHPSVRTVDCPPS
jgi:hypothetical protein